MTALRRAVALSSRQLSGEAGMVPDVRQKCADRGVCFRLHLSVPDTEGVLVSHIMVLALVWCGSSAECSLHKLLFSVQNESGVSTAHPVLARHLRRPHPRKRGILAHSCSLGKHTEGTMLQNIPLYLSGKLRLSRYQDTSARIGHTPTILHQQRSVSGVRTD